MSGSTGGFPDYGDSGDLAGARRARRAFRLCVASVLFLTGMMWFTERFLRHDQTEYLYLSALTLPRESARVMLQQAIKVDTETRDLPTPKYTQALAVRQEDDVILRTYEEARKMDPSDSLFAIRNGCRLFLMGFPGEAADVFREASQHPPNNALPHYLEAASLARAGEGEEALSDAMVAVARTNNSGENVILPRPLWFADLPQDGYWYADLSRDIVDECCALLYHFTRQVAGAVQKQIGQNQKHIAKTWSTQLKILGEKLASDCEPSGTIQGIAGLNIQLRAIELLEELESAENRTSPSRELASERQTVEQAIAMVREFEIHREERILHDVQEVRHPLILVRNGTLGILIAYVLSLILHRLMRLKKSSWTLPHSALGKGILGGGSILLFVILHLLTALQRTAAPQTEYVRAVSSVWWGLLGLLILFGLLYPSLSLKPIGEVSRRTGRPEEIDETLPKVRRAYRRAYVSFVLRYYGILFGLFVCVVCAWVVTVRITTDLYPWQAELLATGLLDEEVAVMSRSLGLLE